MKTQFKAGKHNGFIVGTVFGFVIGIMLDNIGLWLCIGAGLGLAFGNTIKKKSKTQKTHEK